MGTFPGGTILQFIACGFDPEIQVCWRARLQRLQGSESEGHIRFGAEMSTSEDFDDFFFDVVLTPAPPQDTLAVELTPARREVRPVLAGCFNAALQWAGRCLYTNGQLTDSVPVARDDTVRLRLRVFYSPSGLPASGHPSASSRAPLTRSGHTSTSWVARRAGSSCLMTWIAWIRARPGFRASCVWPWRRRPTQW